MIEQIYALAERDWSIAVLLFAVKTTLILWVIAAMFWTIAFALNGVSRIIVGIGTRLDRHTIFIAILSRLERSYTADILITPLARTLTDDVMFALGTEEETVT